MTRPLPRAPRPVPRLLKAWHMGAGVWSLALSTCMLAASTWAEPHGAVGSHSAHEPGSAEETLEHEHGPRHGGAFGDAEDLYHYEVLVEDPGRLILYVNDEHNQPLDTRTLQARWLLNPDDDAPIPGPFTPSEDGSRLLASLPPSDPTQPLHVQIEVLKDSQWVGMEFYLLR